jgi:hypothetical protein
VVESPALWPDITGDDTRELWLAGYGLFSSCGRYLMPLPESGTVDPEASADVSRGVDPNFSIVPDQNGDGSLDVFVSAQNSVLGTPVSVVDGTLTSQSVSPVDPRLFYVRPSQLDFDADGISDFLAMRLPVPAATATAGGDAVMVVASGGAAIYAFEPANTDGAGATTVWNLAGEFPGLGPILEDGIAVAFVQLNGNYVVVDLGPAMPVLD